MWNVVSSAYIVVTTLAIFAVMAWGTSNLSMSGPEADWYQHQCSANPLR